MLAGKPLPYTRRIPTHGFEQRQAAQNAEKNDLAGPASGRATVASRPSHFSERSSASPGWARRDGVIENQTLRRGSRRGATLGQSRQYPGPGDSGSGPRALLSRQGDRSAPQDQLSGSSSVGHRGASGAPGRYSGAPRDLRAGLAFRYLGSGVAVRGGRTAERTSISPRGGFRGSSPAAWRRRRHSGQVAQEEVRSTENLANLTGKRMCGPISIVSGGGAAWKSST
jgi:hypothetical protein